MKAESETQAIHLEKMMRKYRPDVRYELVFPFFHIKSTILEDLIEEDILLLGLKKLEYRLLKEEKVYAKVAINSNKLEIIERVKDTEYLSNSKKYKILKCSFGKLKSTIDEVRYKEDIKQLNLHEVTLFVEDKKVAEGLLVNVEDRVAIKITKVKRDA